MSRRILKSSKIKSTVKQKFNNPKVFSYAFTEDDTSTFLVAVTPAEGCAQITEGADVKVIGSATTWGSSVHSYWSTSVEGLTSS